MKETCLEIDVSAFEGVTEKTHGSGGPPLWVRKGKSFPKPVEETIGHGLGSCITIRISHATKNSQE